MAVCKDVLFADVFAIVLTVALSFNATIQCPALCSCRTDQDYFNYSGLLVDCTYLHLPHVPELIPNNTEILLIYGNNINTISKRNFNDLFDLKYLNIINNPTFEIRTQTFENATSLEVFRGSFLKLSVLSQNVFSPLRSLKILDVSNNGLLSRVDEHAFIHLENLKELKMDNCNLSEEIIVDKVLEPLTSLTHLNLGWNNVKYLPNSSFETLKNLEELFLDGNKELILEDASFAGLQKLEYLNLQKCGISQIHDKLFQPLWNLKVLQLSSNNLVSLEENFLLNIPNLSQLYLNNNKIETISHNALLYSWNLDILDLSHNHLETLPVIKRVTTMQKFCISDNNLKCDCSNGWLVDAVRENQNWTQNDWYNIRPGIRGLWKCFEPVCHLPSRLQGKHLKNLQKDQLESILELEGNISYRAFQLGTLSARMTCPIIGCPAPHITWIVPNHIPPSSHSILDDGSLIISTVQEMHEGQYVCVGRNPEKILKISIDLHTFPKVRPMFHTGFIYGFLLAAAFAVIIFLLFTIYHLYVKIRYYCRRNSDHKDVFRFHDFT